MSALGITAIAPAAATASPLAVERFEEWRVALLACHYASPCPDEVMNQLVDHETARMRDLLDVPVTGAGDVLLKLFLLAMTEHGGRINTPPMAPVVEREAGSHYLEDDIWEALLRDLPVVSIEVAAAMASSSRKTFVS